MNRIITSILLLTSVMVSSQSIERDVIGNAGSTFSDNEYIVDFTIGEVVITSINDGSFEVSQGFHQKNVFLNIKINPIVFLQGALISPFSGEESLMRDDLRFSDLLPTISPYSDLASCDISVFSTTGTDAIVDWVWVELYDANDNTNILFGQSALLQRDGDVVDVDGNSSLNFSNAEPDNYFVAIKHRNHFGIMTANAINLSNTPTDIDFTNANSPITYGTNAQTTVSMPVGVLGMWAGDSDNDGNLSFGNDGNKMLFDLLLYPLNTTFSSSYTLANGYFDSDLNLNGNISFQNDLNNLLLNILLYPGNTSFSSSYNLLNEQIPLSLQTKIVKDKSVLKQRKYISETIKDIQSTINN